MTRADDQSEFRLRLRHRIDFGLRVCESRQRLRLSRRRTKHRSGPDGNLRFRRNKLCRTGVLPTNEQTKPSQLVRVQRKKRLSRRKEEEELLRRALRRGRPRKLLSENLYRFESVPIRARCCRERENSGQTKLHRSEPLVASHVVQMEALLLCRRRRRRHWRCCWHRRNALSQS